jgi:hypothetical protein
MQLDESTLTDALALPAPSCSAFPISGLAASHLKSQ